MVKITCLDEDGRRRICSIDGVRCLETGREIFPGELFASFLLHGWSWEADYSSATAEEKAEWQPADFSARIFRALKNGRPIIFLDKKYQLQEDEDLFEATRRLEEEIIKISGRITIASDDENGLVIGSEIIQ